MANNSKSNFTECDKYNDGIVPDDHVKICLKVIRTVRDRYLDVGAMEEAVLLSHAHKKIVDLARKEVE